MRDGVTPVCPACRGERVEKQLSAFAVGAAAPEVPRRRPRVRRMPARRNARRLRDGRELDRRGPADAISRVSDAR